MVSIDLNYGNESIKIEFKASLFDVLAAPPGRRTLTDVEIGSKLDDPIGSGALEDLVTAGDSVLIVVPDATRAAAAGQIVNLVVRRLIANGTAPGEISIIFATGIHRLVTEAEKASILTPFIAQRINLLDHNARNLAQLVRVGETSGGIPVEINRAAVEADHVVLVCGVSFHYFAGFTGGRKLICPGLASTRTVSQTHQLAFDCSTLSRRTGVDTGLLAGNAVHEAFMEAVSFISPAFSINSIVNDPGEPVDVICGDWREAHTAACKVYAGEHTVEITEKREFVVVCCGGTPHDINMVQAHKAIDAASRACVEGGIILLFAECRDGLGRDDFLNWFQASNSRELAGSLCEKYQVNGQTAWNLFRLAETFDIRIVTDLSADDVTKMRLKQVSAGDAVEMIKAAQTSGFILPEGAKLKVKVTV